MSQRVSAREIVNHQEMAAIRSGTVGLVQCDGCRDRVLVQPGRPRHLDSCELCERHCVCFRIPDGVL